MNLKPSYITFIEQYGQQVELSILPYRKGRDIDLNEIAAPDAEAAELFAQIGIAHDDPEGRTVWQAGCDVCFTPALAPGAREAPSIQIVTMRLSRRAAIESCARAIDAFDEDHHLAGDWTAHPICLNTTNDPDAFTMFWADGTVPEVGDVTVCATAIQTEVAAAALRGHVESVTFEPPKRR